MSLIDEWASNLVQSASRTMVVLRKGSFSPHDDLGPLLRSVQDTGDLNRFLSDAVNNDERQAGDNHLPRVGLAAWSAV